MEKEEIQSILEDYYPYINEFLGEIIEQRLTSPNYEDSILISRLLEAPRRLATLKEDEQVEYEHDMEADAERYLNYVNELAMKKGVSIVKKRSRGNVNKEIVNAVNEDEVDLFVIGELSRIRSRRDEFYDETERAMRTVPCSVLIVKDEDRVWEMYESLG